MKQVFTILIATMVVLSACNPEKASKSNYPSNPEPLSQNKFIQLPLGAIQAQGWLKDQLVAQKTGLTGQLMDFWPDLMTSSWRGGDGEAWERGPYYLDGLVPLAYLLNDEELKAKVAVWMDFILNSAQDSGWFGPAKNTDRWPLAVALKVLKEYYEGSGDDRALSLMTNYFNYLASTDPDWPDHEWRGVRAMENAVTGYWLFRQTRDTTILTALKSIQENSYSWHDHFEEFPWDSVASIEGRIPKVWDAVGLTAHVVNVAMAVKYPGIWSQQSGNTADLQRSFEAIMKLDEHHGQVGGRFSGDEHLSGKSPVQGTEMCAVVEYMFSLENLIEINGDVALADRLEVLAFNSLPGTQTPDGWLHQYDQQANQVRVSDEPRNWSSNGNEANVFGIEPNFGCCTANGHQGWPKYARSLWMASPDGGLAAISYAPCKVDALVGDQVPVSLEINTLYPFEETITIQVNPSKSTAFALYLRIPVWCTESSIWVNGEEAAGDAGEYFVVNRKWKEGDVITLKLPMAIELETRHRNARAVKMGPLYFSLRIPKTYHDITIGKSYRYQGATDWRIEPSGAWNYALLINESNPQTSFEVVRMPVPSLPFADHGDVVWDQASQRFDTLDVNPPLVLKARGMQIEQWQLLDNSAGPVPYSPLIAPDNIQPEEIELVPYASARLRISEFPFINQ